MTLIYIIISTVAIALLAFVGIFALSLNKERLDGILLYLVSFSAGALMGGAFLHLLPEVIEQGGNIELTMVFFLFGFILFFMLEKYLYWRHCHKGKCNIHAFSYLNLLGDAIHNFTDGLIIAVSFVVSPALGVSTSIAIASHEIPQELGDFAVLVYGGFKVKKALWLNFLAAITVVLGGVVGFYLVNYIENSLGFLMSVAAGGFAYIASADLLPEIRKIKKPIVSVGYLICFIFGLILLWLIKYI